MTALFYCFKDRAGVIYIDIVLYNRVEWYGCMKIRGKLQKILVIYF